MNVFDMLFDIFIVEFMLMWVEKLVGMDNKEQLQEIYDVMLKVFMIDVIVCIYKNGMDVLVFFVEGDLLCIMLMGLKCFIKYMLINVKKVCCMIVDCMIEVNGYCF